MTTDEPGRATFRRIDESTRDDWAIITPLLETAQLDVPARVLGLLREMAHDYGGFPVSRLEHSLQTATLAEADGKDEEYVLCALLHDIGDMLSPFNHPAVAAAIIQPFVSKANHWMVEHHGIFQGYYFWQHLGLDRNSRDRFRSSPFFEHTEEFCAKYDQPAFDSEFKGAPLEHFEPLVLTHLVR